MKKIIVMTFLLVCTFVNGQIIFSHEREIKSKENYTAKDIDLTIQIILIYLELYLHQKPPTKKLLL